MFPPVQSSMRRVVQVALVVVAVSSAGVAAQQPAAQPPAAQPPAAAPNPLEDWKPDMLHNLEVLPKDITPDALIKLMKDWNASLNVDCVFCHKGQVGKPWSTYDFTDTAKKRHEVARMMVKSTAGLNEAFKDLGEPDEPVKVTCATCHRRSRHPEITPPAAPAKPEK
jgi:hypothetical protein